MVLHQDDFQLLRNLVTERYGVYLADERHPLDNSYELLNPDGYYA